jgi:hypothetical protein
VSGKSTGKIPFERPRYKWEDNIKIDLMDVRYEGVDWIHETQYWDLWRVLVNTVMNFRSP